MNRRQFLRRTASGLIITVTPTIFLPAWQRPLKRIFITVSGSGYVDTSYVYTSAMYGRTQLHDFVIDVFGWREGQTPLIIRRTFSE